MKTDSKQKKLNISDCHCSDSSRHSGLRHCLVRFCLCSSSLLLPVYSVSAAGAEEISAAEKTIAVTSEASTTETLKNLTAKEYWKSNINAPEKSSKSSSDLLKAIKMLSGAKVIAEPAPKKEVVKTAPEAIVPKPISHSEAWTANPNAKATESETVKALSQDLNIQEAVEVKSSAPENGLISNEIFAKIQQLAKKPETAKSPFVIAEILFKSECPEEACVFYKEALRRNNADKNAKHNNTPWILLQIGNCLRKSNKEESMNSYRLLIKEHPDSDWAYLAKTREKLLAWYETFKPNELIK